jgi:hypothetical protein
MVGGWPRRLWRDKAGLRLGCDVFVRCFTCPTCGRLVFFENSACLHCGTALAFDPDRRALVALGDGVRCANAELARCNWLAPAPGALCASCVRTRTRPADDDARGLEALATAEAAKRRLLFELAELDLTPGEALRFDLLSSDGQPITTGHADGLITLDLAESGDAHREAMREQMGEPYRTVLGHLRHESGHYYWTVLAADEPARERARVLFGDERGDYAAAMERHSSDGPPADWAERHVSAYATMHPSEDWAETFAHYLHIRDTLQTADAYRVGTGIAVPGPRTPEPGSMEALIADWLPLSLVLNQLNRSMGRDDLYPFVLPPAVMDKLALVHDLAGRP